MSYYFSRAIRLMDGPCELHLRQIARFAFGNHMFNELNNAQGYGISKLWNIKIYSCNNLLKNLI